MRDIEKQLTGITCRLIRFKTTRDRPPETQAAYAYIKEMMAGFRIDEYSDAGVKSLVIHKDEAGTKEFGLILLCHIDVVPADENDFIPVIKEGRIYGRGALDMKSGCAVGITLMQTRVNYNTALVITSDEETGGAHGTSFLVREGLKADFVLALENTDMEIVTERKGTIRTVIGAQGKSAHSSTPWEGVNALEKLLACLGEMRKTFPEMTAKDVEAGGYHKTFNLSHISGGDAFNKVPDNAEMWIDIRYRKEDNPDSIIANIKQHAELGGCRIKRLETTPASYTHEDNPQVRKLADISGSPISRKHGASDIRFFTAKGIPAADFGPCGKNIHGQNEYAEIQSIIRTFTLLAEFMKQ